MQIEKILAAARKAGASDIHLIAGIPPAFRVNGEILMANADALSREATAALVTELLTEEQRAAFARERELCVSVFGTSAGRLRLTAYMQAGNPEASIRLCGLSIPSSADLGLPAIIDELTRRPHGLVLITGATGMGKTTTLNYMVDLINGERRCKIITIEDPVEFVHAPRKAIVVQQEVHTDTPSYARALRHVLRQDPNIIVIGEMRDMETIEIALTAAETGHLVISTLHTSGAEQTVERIVSVFPAGRQAQVVTQFAGCMQGVISQALLPRVDRKGRVLATEILLANAAVRNLLRDGNHRMLTTTIQTSARDGMRTMDASLQDLYQTGVITWDTALSHAHDPKQFQQQRAGGAKG